MKRNCNILKNKRTLNNYEKSFFKTHNMEKTSTKVNKHQQGQ